MPEPRTHYQLSFTARQAMVFFVLCLLALGLSYFFGLMTGLSSGSSKAASRAAALTATAVPTGEATPAAAVAAEEPAPAGAEAPPSLTRIAEQASGEPSNAPTAPAVLQTFEDRGAEEPTPTPAPAVAARAVPTPARAAAPPAGKGAATGLWVQVASLTSRSDADSLVARLSRHGYKTQISPLVGPKTRIYRVRVGPYRSEEEARRTTDRLRRQERLPDAWIVREDR